MKKYLFGFAAVIALGFSACTDDEPVNDGPAVSPIVAKWEVTDVSSRVQDSMTNGTLLDTTISEMYAANEMVIDLRANGDAITTNDDGGMMDSDTGYYTYSAPILKLYEDKTDMTDFEEYTVTLSGNNVALKGQDFYETMDFRGFPLALKFSVTINAKKK